MPEKSTRLGPDDWFNTGFAALSAQGPEALKAEPLARSIGATKGSFYWHFKDVPDFKRRMAARWEARALSALADAAEQGGTPTQRLYRLGEVIAEATGPGSEEAAMRAWAQGDDAARAAIAEVDRMRLAYLTAVLSQIGLSNPEFARIVYGAELGLGMLGGTDSKAARESVSTLIAALVALQDA